MHLRRNALLWIAFLFFTCSMVANSEEPQAVQHDEPRWSSWEKHRSMAEQSIFRGLAWRSVGPVDQGGRLVDIEAMPGEPYSFYVAYASGGIWKTVNNGVTFEPLFDDQPCIIIGDVAIDPSNKNTLWVGTGENNSSRSSYGGMGIFRSEDGGISWVHAGLGDSDRIGRIVVHPHDSNTVFAAAIGRLYTQGGQRGVYRTRDKGKSWQCVLQIDDRTGVIDLVMDPSDPDTLYAASWERIRRPWMLDEDGPGSGIWKTEDGGETWARIHGGFPSGETVGRIGLCISQSRPRTIYAMVDNQELLPEEEWDLGRDPLSLKRLRTMTREEFLKQKPEAVDSFLRDNNIDPNLSGKELLEKMKNEELSIQDLLDVCIDANSDLFLTDIHGIEVWRSDDAGASWKKTHDDSLQKLTFTYGYYFGQIRVSPVDAERVYLLGVPLLISEDGGRSFTRRNRRNVHLDQQAMWIDPGFPDRLILGNDGGLNMTYDHGKNWLKLNSTCVGQFYTVFVDMATPYNIYGGLQDNGVLKGPSDWRPGRRPWELLTGGDGMYVQVDPRDGKTCYVGTQFGYYTRIDAKGEHTGIRPQHKLKAPPLRYNWCTPVQLSSFNADILYFGTQRLYRSMDKGETWKAISNDLTTTNERGNVPFGTITTISESPLCFGLIWVGTDDGNVHVTDDGGVEWRHVSASLPPGLWVTRVEASHHDEKTAYVSFSGYREDDPASYLFRTEDLGATWTSLVADMPAEPVNVIHEDPHDAKLLYTGTDRGAYVSLDKGESWHSLSGGLPKVPVHDLAIHPRDHDLVAGTHGRSVWVLDIKPIQSLDDEIRAKALHLFALDTIKERSSWKERQAVWEEPRDYEPAEKIVYWSTRIGEGTISIEDKDGAEIFCDRLDIINGLNTYEWNYLVDSDLALAAEKARPEIDEKTEADAEKSEDKPELETYAKRKKLRCRPYILPGKYTLRIHVAEGDSESIMEFEIKAAE
ncbi:MAG: glycosyl hydrolase [Planctomycetota bacterium]